MKGKIKSRLLRQLTAVFRERELVTTLTSKVIFHQVNSNLSASISMNLDYLLLTAVEKRELVDKYSWTAPSESTTYGKFVLHLYVEYNSVGCLSTRTAVFNSTLFVLYPMYVMQVVVLV